MLAGIETIDSADVGEADALASREEKPSQA
jgi:hypothetical protein